MDDSNHTTERLRRIIQVQSILGSAEFDLPNFMQTVVENMQSLTPATGAVVELLEGDEMVYKAAGGSVAPHVGLRLASAKSLSGLCVQTQELKISGDTSTDPRVNAEACKKVGAASMVCVPLFQHGIAVGVLKVLSTEVNAFTEPDIETLHLMAALLGGALGQQLEMERRKQLEDRLQHMAQHDALTKLPNRALFYDRLSQAIARTARSKVPFAVMYMDIDNFKTVNDTHGHAVGDALLCAFSGRVRGFTRASDTFARLGGDEFILVTENLSAEDDAIGIATKIVNGSQQSFDLNGVQIQISSSIGVAVASGPGIEADKLISRADAALYDAKKAGRNGYKVAPGTKGSDEKAP
jgi:diguanylate cyclase (GGDEF)-like protein